MQDGVIVKDANGEIIAENGYKITLEASAEGDLEMLQSNASMIDANLQQDVVLVVDVSGSMDDPIGAEGTDNKWDILKTAVNNFITTLEQSKSVTKVTLVMYRAEAATAGTFDLKNPDQLADLQSYFLQGETADTNISLEEASNKVIATGYVGYNEDGIGNKQEAKDYAAVVAQGGTSNFLGTSYTNSESGYVEATNAINRLHKAGELSENVTVVYMTDGVANTHIANSPYHFVQDAQNVSPESSNAASDAIVKLLQLNETLDKKDNTDYNVNLHNVAFMDVTNDAATKADVETYLDPAYAGEGLSPYPTLKEKLNSTAGVDYSTYTKFQWAKTGDSLKTFYAEIANDIADSLLAQATIARNARVIDVIPADFDVYLPAGTTDLRIAGKDANGNTIIEWEIGELTKNKTESISYFVVPKDETKYGTLFTNDSAILFAKPLGGQEVAIVMDRPMITLDPKTQDDEKLGHSFDEEVVGNLLTGFPGVDSTIVNRVQAAGTKVSDTKVMGITGMAASIGEIALTVNPLGDKSFVIEGFGTVTVQDDGSVTFDKGSNTWPAYVEESLRITFQYAIGATAQRGQNDPVSLNSNQSTATITINQPQTPPVTPPTPPVIPDDPDPIPLAPPEDEPTPLGAPADGEPIPLGVPTDGEPIPLGVPQTGGIDQAGIMLAAIAALLLAISLTLVTLFTRKQLVRR